MSQTFAKGDLRTHLNSQLYQQKPHIDFTGYKEFPDNKSTRYPEDMKWTSKAFHVDFLNYRKEKIIAGKERAKDHNEIMKRII